MVLRRLGAVAVAVLAAVLALFLAASISVALRGIDPRYPTWRLIAQAPFAVGGVMSLGAAAARLWRGGRWSAWALCGLLLAGAWAIVAFLNSNY